MATLHADSSGKLIRLVRTEREKALYAQVPDGTSESVEFDEETNQAVLDILDRDWNQVRLKGGVLRRGSTVLPISGPGTGHLRKPVTFETFIRSAASRVLTGISPHVEGSYPFPSPGVPGRFCPRRVIIVVTAGILQAGSFRISAGTNNPDYDNIMADSPIVVPGGLPTPPGVMNLFLANTWLPAVIDPTPVLLRVRRAIGGSGVLMEVSVEGKYSQPV